jgi:hypothetical protein
METDEGLKTFVMFDDYKCADTSRKKPDVDVRLEVGNVGRDSDRRSRISGTEICVLAFGEAVDDFVVEVVEL